MARPVWLARPCGMTDPDGQASATTATLIRAIGARDAAIGTAMVLTTNPQALRTISVCRTAADLSDAVVFGSALTGDRRTKVTAFATGWGILCALAARRAGR
ncbi:DUF4267 domain-containing protein [Streptomyces sp. NPDC055056]